MNYNISNTKSNDNASQVQREDLSRKGISLPAVPVLKQDQQNEKAETINHPAVSILQAKCVNQASGTKAFPLNQIIQKKNDTGLPDKLKAGIEELSGFNMDDVKVHYNSDKPAQLQAFAYAQGTNIHVAQGQEKHLPHEAWHVVQQKQGRVQPTLQLKDGKTLNNNTALEIEADVMSTKSLNETQPKTALNIPSATSTKHTQVNLQNNMPMQLMQQDASDYVFRHKDELYEIDTIKNGLLKGCKKDNGEWWIKWKNEDNRLIYLTRYISEKVDKDWVKETVADKSLPSKLRLGLFYAWNQDREEPNKEEEEFVESTESDILSQELVADLVKNVSNLTINEGNRLKRSDSFTFGENKGTGIYKPTDILEKMTDKVIIETGKDKRETYPSTNSIQLAGLYIRAYGDNANIKDRIASTKFVFNLGGSLGVYRDTTSNGDLFYFPLIKLEGEDVYRQEGGSTEHTWDKLANHLSKVDGLENVHIRLAQALSSEYEGELSKSEVIAIGAMLADAKYSIQGWLYAVEELKKYEFDGKQISELFAITGSPFWQYSLNASNIANQDKDSTEMGRQAGIGYKKTFLEQVEAVEEKDNKRKRNDSTGDKEKKSTLGNKKESKKIKLTKDNESSNIDHVENGEDIQNELLFDPKTDMIEEQ